MFEIVKIERKGYGYELENPIKVFGVMGINNYLNCLNAKDGIIVKFHRDHSCGMNQDGHIIDCYHIFVLHLEEPIEIRKFELFFDMYNYDNDDIYPEDFEKK